jgi:indolepyruvate ferredoxin oxidoreductase
MSRFAGVWTGMKTIQEIVESSATAQIDPTRVQIVVPEFDMPHGGVHIRWPDDALSQEARLFDYKWYAALAYVRANRLNHNVIEGADGGRGDRLGLIASGKAYNDTRQALADLGLDDEACRQIGIRLHKVAVVWPLEAQLTREFATGLQEILVVEEKRQVIEYQLKEELYNWRADVRPNVLGKFNEVNGDFSGGEWSMPNPSANTLLRANADLSPALIARAIAQRVKKLGVGSDLAARIDSQLAVLEAKERAMQTLVLGGAQRQPWFCSGCPHNTSTKVPDGSRAMAGIGCHIMAMRMDRSTTGFTQMGGEGVPWVGQQPFTNEQHIFANLGDGTYFHSGILAIRQSIAAGVNITYKLLYNDAVAMTGGQPVGERPEGHTVLQIAHSLTAEGVARLVIVTDEPEKYEGATLPAGVAVHHRDELDDIQRQFRDIKGTSAIVYDQTCATEKRRRRKRGTLADPQQRVVINEAVCEGCGDCGEQSNCMSVEPLETEFGRKRTINQSTCNKDFSCTKGFCPSFVTVEGAPLRKPRAAQATDPLALGEPPLPTLPTLVDGQAWGLVVAGVGGTGVITIGQLLGMAAHLEGLGIVTQDAAGLAQKGGATWSHVLLAKNQDTIRTTRVGTAGADLVIGCDPVVTAYEDTLQRMRPGRTRVALNTHGAPTAAFVHHADWQNPAAQCVADIARVLSLPADVASAPSEAAQARPDALGLLDADAMAQRLMGDTLYTNPILLGYAWQRGWLPLGLPALLRAMELNAVSVAQNQRAFAWGRLAAHAPASVARAMGSGDGGTAQVVQFKKRETLEELVTRRERFLTEYQNPAYAASYRAFVERIRATEAPLGKTTLTEACARYLFKLMAYKDEYEVARLHADPAFHARLAEQFEGPVRLSYHLAPPLLSKRNAQGELVKRRFGHSTLWAFKFLARLKGLRGTPLDVFGYTEERRGERQLIDQYRQTLEELQRGLNEQNHALAVEVARLPEHIRGYGHVKARHLADVQPRWTELMARWRLVGQASAEARAA